MPLFQESRLFILSSYAIETITRGCWLHKYASYSMVICLMPLQVLIWDQQNKILASTTASPNVAFLQNLYCINIKICASHRDWSPVIFTFYSWCAIERFILVFAYFFKGQLPSISFLLKHLFSPISST